MPSKRVRNAPRATCTLLPALPTVLTRWIGFKVGTYLADRAARTSGPSVAQLFEVPAKIIMEWAR